MQVVPPQGGLCSAHTTDHMLPEPPFAKGGIMLPANLRCVQIKE